MVASAGKKNASLKDSFIQIRQLLVVALLSLSLLNLAAYPIPSGNPSNYPTWWFSRGAIVPLVLTNPAPSWPTDYPTVDNYAVINEGQLKNFATQSYNELQAHAPSSVWTTSQGTNLVTMVAGWGPSTGDNYQAVNLGQLKTLAKPFYDLLIRMGYTTRYPWTGSGADDYSVANIGQVKNIFAFDVALDSDANGLPDWWEMLYFGQLGNIAGSNPSGNGLTLLQDYQQGNDPTNFYSQGGQTLTPSLTIISGNNQTSTSAQLLPNPLLVQVKNGSGTSLANAPVTFFITSGGGSLSSSNPVSGQTVSLLQTTTDASGDAQVYLQQPNIASSSTTIDASSASALVSFTATTTVNTGVPAAPTGITASPGSGPGEIYVSWVNHADNADYIVLQQSTDGASWTTTATITDATTTSYRVTGLSTLQSYYFRVAAGNHY